MADDPFLDGPPVLVPMDSVQIYEPVEICLQVLGLHAGEAFDIPADPRAEMVHEGHLLEIDGVGGDGLVALVHEPEAPDERIVGLLAVMDDGRPFLYVRLERIVDSLRGGLPVLADDGKGLLVRVDRDDDADLVLGEPLPPWLSGLVLCPGILEVHLVDPDAS